MGTEGAKFVDLADPILAGDVGLTEYAGASNDSMVPPMISNKGITEKLLTGWNFNDADVMCI